MDLNAQLNCSACGYDLMGVAPVGRCPECGQEYDIALGQGVTKRSAKMLAHERGDRVMYLVKMSVFVLLAAICVGLGALRMGLTGDKGPMALGLLIGGLFAFGAFVTWFTERK